MKHLPFMKGTVKTYSVSSDKLMKKKNILCVIGVMNEDFWRTMKALVYDLHCQLKQV